MCGQNKKLKWSTARERTFFQSLGVLSGRLAGLFVAVVALHSLPVLSQGLFMKYALSGLLTTEQIIIFLYAITEQFVHLFV